LSEGLPREIEGLHERPCSSDSKLGPLQFR
jgi:hypothetical protein